MTRSSAAAAWKNKGKGKQSEEVTPFQEEAAKKLLSLVWAGSLEQARTCLKDLVNSHPGLADTAFFRHLLRQCSQARSPGAARWCFDQMLEAGVTPNLVTFNMFLDSCAKAGSLGLAEQWWCEMPQYGLKPSSVTYNIMINACAQGRNATRAEQWLEQMLKSNVRPSCVTFGTVVDSYAKLGNIAKAEAWATEMQNHGFPMDRVIYNSLANACAKAGKPKRAEAWFDEMQNKGITPNEKAYNSIMQAWARAGKVEYAEVWFTRLQQSGCTADEITFCSMIHVAARLGNVNKLEAWMQAMIEHGLSPNTICYNALLNLLARRGLSKKAALWMETMQESAGATPNAITYNSVIKACMVAGEDDQGLYWLEQMIKAGVHPDGSTIHALASGHANKEGRLQVCEDLNTGNTRHRMCTPPRAGQTAGQGQEKSQPFSELLQSLSSVYQAQADQIQSLSCENKLLRTQLANNAKRQEPKKKLAGEDGVLRVDLTTSGWRRVPLMSTLNVQPEILEEQTEAASLDEQPLTGQPSAVTTSQPDVPLEEEFRRGSTASWRMTMIPDVWAEWAKAFESQSIRVWCQEAVMRENMSSVRQGSEEPVPLFAKISQHLVVAPSSFQRLCWDFLSTVMVCYDLVAIPLMVLSLEDGVFASDPNPSFNFFLLMDWVTISFWSLDMPWSFLTGFYADGEVELRAVQIAKNYLKSWFTFDLFVLSVEWLTIYLESHRSYQVLGFLRIGKSARLLRIARTVRLLRFVKLHKLMELVDVLNSPAIRAMLNIFLAFSFIFVFSHYLACGWYLIGYLSTNQSWLTVNGFSSHNTMYAYFTALHWSLTLFTPASTEIHPANLAERIYSICCLNFALVAFSSFLGSITASITELRNHRKDTSQQEYVLRSYLARNNVSYRLSRRIWRFLRENHFKHQQRSRSLESAIPLRLLPPHLQTQLYQELYGPYLTRNPFFHQYSAFWSEGLVDVCTKGISEQSLLCGESLFVEGKVAEKMFFVASGCVYYDHCNPMFSHNCGIGAWISEAVLWVRWVHLATLYAQTSCQVIELDSAKFRDVMEVFKRSLSFVRAYAHFFQEHLKLMGVMNLSDIMTDIPGLQGVTRKAWMEVAAPADKGKFKELKELDFPTRDNHRGGFLRWARTRSRSSASGLTSRTDSRQTMSPSLGRRQSAEVGGSP